MAGRQRGDDGRDDSDDDTISQKHAVHGGRFPDFYSASEAGLVHDEEELFERAGSPDLVVVDPPRAGLAGKALRRLARLEAPRIVYVSCNPTTLASDLKTLRDDWGYQLVRARPVDMFPHTPHIETVTVLERPA